MATTKFYLDLRGRAKDGKGTIYVSLYHNLSTALFPTGVRVSPKEWDGNKVVKTDCAEAINAKLQEYKTKIDIAVAKYSFDEGFENRSAPELKHLLLKDKPSSSGYHLIADLFSEYINGGNLKEGTKDIYRITARKVATFSGNDFKIEDLDLKWLRRFDSYLAKTQKANGKAIYLRSLRAICNYAGNNNIKCQYPFKNFKIKQEPTRKRSLRIDQFKKFLLFPTSGRNDKYRDYFLLMFFLIGINVKDLLLAKKSQLVNGRFEYTRSKTGKKYSVKVEPEAQVLIDRYSGCGDYLLEAMDHCQSYKSFAREINEALREIGPVVIDIEKDDDLFSTPREVQRVSPIIEGISTQYARHTWATMAYEIGIPMDIVSQAMGHSFGNRTTLIYVRPDQKKVDDANRKMIDYIYNIN